MANEQGKVFASLEEELEELGKGLTDKQQLFCMYYIKTLNATTSYKKAYDCNYNSAMTNGSRMMGNDKIRDYIGCLKRQRSRDLCINHEDILDMYKKIAFADMTDFIDFQQVEGTARNIEETYDAKGGKIVKTEEVPYTYTKFAMHPSEEVDGTVITELQRGKDGVFKVKLADKMAALAFLSKYTNMLNDDEIKQMQVAKLRHEVEQLEKQNEAKQTNIIIVDEWGKE